MKRKLLLVFVAFAGFVLNASGQITITSADMPKNNDNIIYSTSTSKIDISKTGENYSWDFSDLIPATNDTIKFSSPSGLYAVSFFGNLAQKTKINNYDGLMFFKNNSTEWAQNGIGIKIPMLNLDVPLKFNNSDQVYKFPLTYGSKTYSDTFGGVTTMQGIKIAIHGKRTTVIDGYGKVTTPFGTFDCIRLKSTVIEKDTIVIAPVNNSRIEYTWLAKGQKIPVLQVVINETTQQATVTYRDEYRNLTNQIAPKPAFTTSDSTIIVGDTVNFTNKTTGFNNTYTWTISPASYAFVTGTTSTSANPKVQFNAEGKYTITLSATNFLGTNKLIKTDHIVVSKALAPVADFRAARTSLYRTDTTMLFDLSTNEPVSWLWTITPNTVTFMNGTNNTSKNPVIRFDEATVYSVKLASINRAGTSQDSKGNYINVTYSVGVNETQGIFDGVTIWPNPSNAIFTVGLPKNISNNTSIIIYDMLGKAIKTEIAQEKSNVNIDLSGKQRGIYLIRIVNGKHAITKQVVLQ